jgi:hypothetical protein
MEFYPNNLSRPWSMRTKIRNQPGCLKIIGQIIENIFSIPYYYNSNKLTGQLLIIHSVPVAITLIHCKQEIKLKNLPNQGRFIPYSLTLIP